MSISTQTKVLLNGTIHAFKELLPDQVTINNPSTYSDTHAHLTYSVLIGMVGDMKARIIIDADENIFSKLCSSLYGFQLEGELLESFVGELGNMVAGKLCVYSSVNEIQLDITTPTVMIGSTNVPITSHTFSLPIEIINIGKFNLLLSIEND